MLFYMTDKRFEIATIKANEVLEKLSINSDETVDTGCLVEVVEKLTNTKVYVKELDFNTIDTECHYGAMMCVTENSDGKSALIILNSNQNVDARFRRFSLVHELGHLLTGKYNVANSDNQFTLSTHIDYRFNHIEEEYDDDYLLNEEIANIFALKVLLPSKTLFNKLAEGNDYRKIADFFGVSEEALISRMRLGI